METYFDGKKLPRASSPEHVTSLELSELTPLSTAVDPSSDCSFKSGVEYDDELGSKKRIPSFKYN